MICHKDKTFCPFWEDCNKDKTCNRALTDQVKKEAILPISQYADKPKCFKNKQLVY